MPPDDKPNPSVSDSLNATIDAMEQSATPPSDAAAAPVAPAPAEAAPAAAASAPAPQDKGTGRDASGRFLKKAGDADAPAVPKEPIASAAPDANKLAEGAPTDGKVAMPPVVPAADDAPTSWTPDAKAKWAALDPQVRGEIARREREITTGLQRASDSRKFGDSVMQEFAPYAEILSKEGATPQQAVRALLETSYTLRFGSPEHKHALFMSLAQQYGIDLGKQVDPEKARLEWELDSRKHNDMRGSATAQEQLNNEVRSELEQFIAAPGHEHFETLRPVMAGMLSSGAAKDLQDAYDQACWANPSIRSSMQLAESTKKAADQAKNRNALAAVQGAPGAVATGNSAIDPTNMRALIEAGFSGDARRV